jgi:anti-sigma factor RsiW
MNHPSELLADLLDGSLDASDRAQLDSHLAICQTCRTDLAAAAAGRDAIRSLPPAAPPPDLHDRIVTAAGRHSSAPAWYRWAGVAAAAAVIAVIALALPDIGGGADRAAMESAAPESADSAAGGTAGSSVPLEVESRLDFGEDDLRTFAASAGERSMNAPVAAARTATAGRADEAIACVVRSLGDSPPGQLVRLIRARFDGDPAYLAVYVEGPGAGQPGDLGVVYVASVEGCMLLNVTQTVL